MRNTADTTTTLTILLYLPITYSGVGGWKNTLHLFHLAHNILYKFFQMHWSQFLFVSILFDLIQDKIYKLINNEKNRGCVIINMMFESFPP